jgi:DNA-binding CsgD family transcriptional regulator
MGRSSSAARAESRLKQLCCLGLGREAVIPAILDELRVLVPNLASLSFFLGKRGGLVGGFTNNPEASKTHELYFSEFHGRRGRELGGAFPDNVHTQFGVQDHGDALNLIKTDLPSFDRSDFYNLIYRAQRVRWFMRLMVRDDGGRGPALGCVTMYRGPKDKPWTLEDKRRLAALEAFFAVAFKDTSESDGNLTDSGQNGLIVADLAGRAIYFSQHGLRLLNLVRYPRPTTETVLSDRNMLPPPVAKLCRDLARIFGDDPSVDAPELFHRNIWGGFTFRAHWLNGEASASGLIGITITHKEPAPVAMMRRVSALPLSPRQAEVCFLMANGATNETIAEQLGISKHTAIAHGRWIYNKLDVHNRTELVSKLLFAAG